MNAMIRVFKGALALLALAGLGWLLRWVTAGSITGLRTYDLDSLTVLAVGTVAWIAYIWLALAVVLTVLEQIPGVVGALAGAIAGRITTKTARALLRSGLGVAAVTPLTVGVAHAAPGDSAHVRQVTESNPQSANQFTGSDFRSTEPASTIHLGMTAPRQDTGAQGNYRATEAGSSLEIGGTTPQRNTSRVSEYRATERPSSLEIGGTAPQHGSGKQNDNRATEAASGLEIGGNTPHQDTSRLSDFRATEPPSSLELGGAPKDGERTSAGDAAAQQSLDNFRRTEPSSKLQLGNPTATDRPTAKPGPASTPERPTDSRKLSTQERSTTPDKPTATGKAGTSGRPADTGKAGTSERSADSRKAGTSARPAGSEKAGTSAGDPAGVGRTASGKPTGSDQQPGGRTRVGVPDRPTDGAPTRYTDLHANVPVSVVVRAGDSLWSIAARELGPNATDAAITARWHDWYAANRHVIGNDPDLILPGQVLRIPPTSNGDHLPPHHQEQ